MMDAKDITRAMIPVFRNGDAAQAQALVQAYGDRADALPEMLVLFGTRGLNPGQLRAMLETVFGADADDLRVAKTSAAIGRLGFSFPQWRFLSQRFNDSCLLEHFGMARLRRDTDLRDAALPEPQRDEFGPGFVAIDGDTYIEYRRAYVLCADSGAALVIRNNSWYFGRDRLSEPAYIAPVPMMTDRLTGLSPQDFQNTGDFIRWQDAAKQGPALAGHAERLVKTFDAYDARLSAWLLDDGLPALAAFLRTRAHTQGAPWLAAIDPASPPWFPKLALRHSDYAVATDLSQTFRRLAKPGAKFVLLSSADGDLPARPASAAVPAVR